MTTDVLALNALAPGRDLDAYVQTISAFPVLTPEDERELAERFYYENDLEAAREAGAVPSAVRGSSGPKLSRLRSGRGGPHSGRQRRPHEGGQALQSGSRRTAGVLRRALDQG